MHNIFHRSLILTALLAFTAITGCKKSGKDNTEVTFVNNLDQGVTLDIFASEDDYANNNNVQLRKVIGPNDKATLPGNTFTDDKVYFMDWYTSDYNYSNWSNENSPSNGHGVRITPKPGDNTYYMDQSVKGQSRNAFLKGDGTETKWIAIGAYLFSSSTGYSDQWPNLSNNDRYREIVVKKNFTAAYSHKNTDGNIVADNIDFFVHQADVPYIEFKDANENTIGNMTGGKLPTAAPPAYQSNALDTVTALFPDNEYIFMMVRQ